MSTDRHLSVDGRVRSRAGLVALGGAMACWGSTVVTIKIAARGLTTLAITAIEVSTALVVLGFAVLVRRSRPPRPTWGVVCAGVLEPGLAYVLINAGLARTSGTHAGLLIGLESVFVILFAVLVRRVRLNVRTLVAVGLVVAGAALLTSGADGSADLTGDALVLAGVLAAAVYVLVVQRLALSFDPLVLTFYQFVFGGIVLVPVAGAVLIVRPARPRGESDDRPDRRCPARRIARVCGGVCALQLGARPGGARAGGNVAHPDPRVRSRVLRRVPR